ncbi:MAG TPA: serine/threonine-protein kinase, partial [Candidatus Krumholzibacteria bacterium]|nr:serine/threonine-protein kinase [Candidatus Krumholzibacteria bacterium]
MTAEFRAHSRSDSSHASDPSRFAELDSQTQDSAFKGVSVAASMYAAVYLAAFVSDWITQIVADHRFQFPALAHIIYSALSIGYALYVAFRCRRGRCPTIAFARVASLFLVASSLGISLHNWGWERWGNGEMAGVSWVGVWIILYSCIVTLPPRQVLVTCLLAALTSPAVALASVLVHGIPAGFAGSPWIAITRLTIPLLICAGISYAVAYRVFKMATDVSKARRLGSYQLTEKIGAGGMGEVWKAKHKMLARPAAIKLIRPESFGMSGDDSEGRTLLRRFEREAQATAMLTSPHSIMLYDFGIAGDGVFYYVMELLEGRDLKSLIRDCGPVPAERAVYFLRAACDSLADAHHRGLIHRDIKPANLITCRRGRDFDFIKVLDFGLVKSVREPGDMVTQLTASGVASGTPGFMAPEMVTGESTVDGRADIYALGCVGYWLLTGQLVFDGATPMSILIQHVKETPPRVSSRTEIDVPHSVEEIIQACLAKNPGDRPASAEQLGDMLAGAAATLPAWTRERAEAWWRTNLPRLCATPPEGGASTSAATV